MVGNDVAIEILIRSFRRLGLNVNHVNSDGLTALLVAAKSGFIACASLLAIDGRANVSRTDPETGLTAEQLARERGCSLADVMPFSVAAGNTGGGKGSAAGRGAFWMVKAAWSSIQFSDCSGPGDTKDGDRGVDEEGLTKGGRGKKGADDGVIAIEQREGGGRELEKVGRPIGEFRMGARGLFQRSSSLPSLRIGFEGGLLPSPFSLEVQPCSASLSGSGFTVTLATSSSHSAIANDETSEPRRSPGPTVYDSADGRGQTPGTTIGLDSNLAEGSGRGRSGDAPNGREAFQSEVRSGSGGREMAEVIRGRQPYEDQSSSGSLTPSSTINDCNG